MEGWYTGPENEIKFNPKEFIEIVEKENMNNYSKICKKTESTQICNCRYKFNHLEKMFDSDDEKMNTVVFIHTSTDHGVPESEPVTNSVGQMTGEHDCTVT